MAGAESRWARRRSGDGPIGWQGTRQRLSLIEIRRYASLGPRVAESPFLPQQPWKRSCSLNNQPHRVLDVQATMDCKIDMCDTDARCRALTMRL